jgi:hypothetical protein
LGNKTEDCFTNNDHDIVVNERTLLSTFLDIRTKDSFHLSSSNQIQLKDISRKEYTKFYLVVKKYERELAKKTAIIESEKGTIFPTINYPSHDAPTQESATGTDNQDDIDPNDIGISASSTYISGTVKCVFHASDGGESDSSSSSLIPQEKPEEQIVAEDKSAAYKEFSKVAPRWMELKINWRSKYPDEEFPDSPDLVEDLMKLDVGVIYKNENI